MTHLQELELEALKKARELELALTMLTVSKASGINKVPLCQIQDCIAMTITLQNQLQGLKQPE